MLISGSVSPNFHSSSEKAIGTAITAAPIIIWLMSSKFTFSNILVISIYNLFYELREAN
jgi:hypothetical protein